MDNSKTDILRFKIFNYLKLMNYYIKKNANLIHISSRKHKPPSGLPSSWVILAY